MLGHVQVPRLGGKPIRPPRAVLQQMYNCIQFRLFDSVLTVPANFFFTHPETCPRLIM
jgi:hypothetical protein